MIVSTTRPNIVFFFWDNLGWGEVGCYGGGVLRGAPTPRIDSIAAAGLKLLNFNVEAQCTPSRSALLTGRHPIRSGTSLVPATGGPDGLTRWEVTIAQALADAGYATGMWGKWHLGSDPEQRSPIDFGFDEAVWCPRTADEVLWTMQSYFPDGSVTATPYAGEAQVLLEHESIYSRRKGEGPEVLATYDAAFRAEFDRKITDWAIEFMRRATQDAKPFFAYLPYTQVHIPPIPDPEFAGKTKRGNIADLLTQMDAFTGRILDALDELGVGEDTIVIWASDNGADPNFRYPAGDPDPFGGMWSGFSRPWRGGYFNSLEGSNRAPCLVRWPGRVPAGKVSNELVHQVDWFTTLLQIAGAEVPTDRQIDGMAMVEFLLGDAEESGRDTVLCLQGGRLQAVKWHQWKLHLLQQDEMSSTWAP
jgi:arylsulfatase A-like enzyme